MGFVRSIILGYEVYFTTMVQKTGFFPVNGLGSGNRRDRVDSLLYIFRFFVMTSSFGFLSPGDLLNSQLVF